MSLGGTSTQTLFQPGQDTSAEPLAVDPAGQTKALKTAAPCSVLRVGPPAPTLLSEPARPPTVTAGTAPVRRGQQARFGDKCMFGRRRDARYVVSSNEGVLQVARDVSVIWTDGELIAISSEPATVGELLRIEMIVNGHTEDLAVRVEESRPIVADGAIRHRIRLTRIHPSGRASNSTSENQKSRWKIGRILPGRRRPSLPD